jgi:hypothetical protein
MSKNFLTKILIALAWVATAVLWLLSVVMPDTFGFFNLNWAVVVICGTGGLALLLRGLFSKKTGVLKKTDIYFGAFLLIIAAVSVAFAIALPKKVVWPILAIILAVAGLLSVLATGGKKWDAGDNQKVGYKDYRTRKAEEEERKNDGATRK